VLTLVPAYTADDVIRELSQGRWDPAFDQSHRAALEALIPGWSARVAMADFAVLREYSSISNVRLSARLLAGCDLPELLDRARRTLDWRDVQARAIADSMP
jgi:hypothetical protein